MAELPEPGCRYGYTVDQVRAILGDRFEEFTRWMRGQTVGLCEGREYNHRQQEWYDTHCGPHGMTIYPSDVHQFLTGRRPLD